MPGIGPTDRSDGTLRLVQSKAQGDQVTPQEIELGQHSSERLVLLEGQAAPQNSFASIQVVASNPTLSAIKPMYRPEGSFTERS